MKIQAKVQNQPAILPERKIANLIGNHLLRVEKRKLFEAIYIANLNVSLPKEDKLAVLSNYR